jgi:hypothetical protein
MRVSTAAWQRDLLLASCASMTTRGSLPRNQKTAGVSHLPSFDD